MADAELWSGVADAELKVQLLSGLSELLGSSSDAEQPETLYRLAWGNDNVPKSTVLLMQVCDRPIPGCNHRGDMYPLTPVLHCCWQGSGGAWHGAAPGQHDAQHRSRPGRATAGPTAADRCNWQGGRRCPGGAAHVSAVVLN